VAGSLPALFEATEELADHSDRFAVVTFHAPDIAEFDELDAPLAKLETRRWKREFPFPIVLDPSGETAKRYGVTGYPSSALIGPDGSILAIGDARERLVEILSE